MREAAEHVGLSYQTLVRIHSAGLGPVVTHKVGTCRLYRAADLDAWNAERLARKAA